MGNYVIGVGNYVIATPSELGNYVIADSQFRHVVQVAGNGVGNERYAALEIRNNE
jgi:hypothetical protein